MKLYQTITTLMISGLAIFLEFRSVKELGKAFIVITKLVVMGGSGVGHCNIQGGFGDVYTYEQRAFHNFDFELLTITLNRPGSLQFYQVLLTLRGGEGTQSENRSLTWPWR